MMPYRHSLITACVLSAILAAILWLPPHSTSAGIPLRLAPVTNAVQATASLQRLLHLPGDADVYLRATDDGDWLKGEWLRGDLILPTNAPDGLKLMAFFKDRDGHWYQALHDKLLRAGTNRWQIAIDASAEVWQPVGHHGVWEYRSRLTPQLAGLRIFSRQTTYTGTCHFASIVLTIPPKAPPSPPFIRNLRANRKTVPCHDLFELRMDLPDRYANPFDPKLVDLTATIETPDGRTNLVHGFFTRDFFRQADSIGETLVPQGRSHWRIRYSPTVPGRHRCLVTVRDAGGQAEWGPVEFDAVASERPGFVRVDQTAPRHFAFDNDRPFFPIGHNIRSPFDERMDEQFPWRFRHPEGSLAYRRYFRRMAEADANFAEIWMCAWSLGLEWSSVHPGYHGAGDYHLGNAWELDRVLEWAREYGIRINLVLNNHGRVGTWYDGEWPDHPYNADRGGFIPADKLMQFFEHPRALELQRRILRYTVARWGWDDSIFAWELWSELDLAGAPGQKPRVHHDPAVLEWHRLMGDYLRQIDPNRHLIATHLSSNYRATNPDLVKLPQLDHFAIDAYHGSENPLHIVQLIRETADYYEQFDKPVLITEFGGSSMGAGLNHLKQELHAALWTSTSTLLAGTPLFWWWQVIDEQNLYDYYQPLSRFMRDLDRRDPDLRPTRMNLHLGIDDAVSPEQIDSVSLATGTRAVGWIFIPSTFAPNATALEHPIENLSFSWVGCSNSVYRIAFWDTSKGQPIRQIDRQAEQRRLRVKVPPLRRDMAFKIFPRPRDPDSLSTSPPQPEE